MKKKLKSNSPSNAAACSPSSLTPERDAIWEKHDGLSPSLAADMILFAGQMEIQRNELRCEVVTLIVALKDIVAGNHGAMVRARKILSENETSPSVDAKEKPMP